MIIKTRIPAAITNIMEGVINFVACIDFFQASECGIGRILP